jgi:diguanylate cyclase (GGDEF)-like protein/PAS domain S-box-containing protein
VAAGLFAAVFGIRAAEVVDVEAADSLLAAPIALVAMAFGVSGGIVAGLVAAAAFAAGEAMDSAKLTWDEVAVRAVGFTALGSFVGVAATALRHSRAQFAAAFDNAPTAILLTDTGGVITAANAAAERLLGRAKTDLVGTPLATLSDPFDSDVDDVEWESLRAGEILNYTTERRLVSATGGGVPVLMALSRMTSRHDGTEVIVHLVDLSAQRRSEEQLAHLADHDPLTGLFNRRRFDLELRQHLLRVARHGPVGAVLLLDLDHFKYVNDTLGHAVGDIVLRGVADALAERVRAADVLARLGGDEFAILLPDASSRADVETAAADVLAIVSGISIALPDTHAGPVEDVHVTASIGAALVPPFADPDRLLTAADLAMYEAKEAGRSQAKIHSTQSAHAERIRAGFTWGERIRQALVDRRFELHLQPIVPLSGREAHQYEALLRLSDGGRLWYPAEFLRHGERLGLMGDIDRYVVERAAQLLAELPPQLRPRLEVNLSAASLGDEKLSEWIDQLLHRYDVSPTSMIFEITETVAIANMALAGTTIRQLQERGCGFALDDFGVGVSSFYYLRELPFDILKIDGEFVRDLATNRANQLIVRSMIDAARGLGKITVAEFVESLEIAEILRQLGCDYAQGHFFGKARPAAEVLPAR